MNDNHFNNRRNFLRKVGITTVVMTGLPAMMAQANVSLTEKKDNTRNGMVFLFQGDSITDGNRGRNTDPNHIMGHGYAFSIASRLGADYPEKQLLFYNRGISGNRVSDLAARWQKDTLDLKPNVLSILVGVNDMGTRIKNGGAAPDQFEEIYGKLLEQTKTLFPDILFVLCQPFILPVGNMKDKWELKHAEIMKDQAIVAKLAKTYNAVHVEFQQVMEKACRKAPADYWMWDGCHPTVPGHELLTREWIKMVSKRLTFLK